MEMFIGSKLMHVGYVGFQESRVYRKCTSEQLWERVNVSKAIMPSYPTGSYMLFMEDERISVPVVMVHKEV